jgi:hypothetical protein
LSGGTISDAIFFHQRNMTALHDHERWLDTLDAKLRVEGDAIRVCFDHPTEIPLRNCADLQGLKLEATRLRSILAGNQTHLPRKYLIERFVGLALSHHRLAIAQSEVMDELRAEWNVKDEWRDF